MFGISQKYFCSKRIATDTCHRSKPVIKELWDKAHNNLRFSKNRMVFLFPKPFQDNITSVLKGFEYLLKRFVPSLS